MSANLQSQRDGEPVATLDDTVQEIESVLRQLLDEMATCPFPQVALLLPNGDRHLSGIPPEPSPQQVAAVIRRAVDHSGAYAVLFLMRGLGIQDVEIREGEEIQDALRRYSNEAGGDICSHPEVMSVWTICLEHRDGIAKWVWPWPLEAERPPSVEARRTVSPGNSGSGVFTGFVRPSADDAQRMN